MQVMAIPRRSFYNKGINPGILRNNDEAFLINMSINTELNEAVDHFNNGSVAGASVSKRENKKISKN